MEIHTTARRVKVTPAVQRQLEERLAKLARYVPEVNEVHVKLTAEKYRHLAEILIHVRHGDLVAREEAGDLMSAVDGAAERLEQQLRKLKERRSRKVASRRVANGDLRRTAAQVALGEPQRPRPARAKAAPARAAARRPRVLRAGPDGTVLSLEEAVDRLLGEEIPFLVFVDSKSDTPCVLYRRPDGQLALVEGRR